MPSRSALLAALLLILLLAPLAEAHLTGSRPILQRAQRERIVDLQPGPLGARVDLLLSGEPLRQLVMHDLAPHTGRFYIEHREDASVAEDRFYAEWKMERILEFRDLNVDGLYQPDVDTVVRSWRFSQLEWRREAIQTVQLADVIGTSIVWTANRTGTPTIRMEVAMAGKDFSDEGALVRPQDLVVYMDVTEIPPRDIGSLYAFEIDVTVQPDTFLGFHTIENTSTALLADAPMRRALLVWGGEAFLDGREQRIAARIVDERIEENKTATLFLNLPTVDRSMRFVFVTGLEHGTEIKRGTPAGAWIALVALGLALAARRR